MDLSHYNLRAYQKQFIETDLSIKYADKSMSEFQSAPEIHSNIRGMIIDSYNQAKFNYLKYSNMNVLFVDSLNNVYDMKVLIDND